MFVVLLLMYIGYTSLTIVTLFVCRRFLLSFFFYCNLPSVVLYMYAFDTPSVPYLLYPPVLISLDVSNLWL